MLSGSVWTNACILNISSRGLLVQTSRSTPQDSIVELRRGDHVIVARVIWRQGARAGLIAERRLPVEEILSLGQSPALDLRASDCPRLEQRKRPRTHEESRFASRAMEFAGVAVIAICLAGTGFAVARSAMARPLAYIEAALHG